MRVSDLAKELNRTSDEILAKLKALKLKAKGSSQELSAAVVSVLKSELDKGAGSAGIAKDKTTNKIVQKDVSEKESKKIITKKNEKGSVKGKAKKETVKKEEKPVKAKAVKPRKTKVKVAKKSVVKKKSTSKLKSTASSKKKISKEPVITLKPLVRKRKKQHPSSKDDSKSSVEKIEEEKVDGVLPETIEIASGKVDGVSTSDKGEVLVEAEKPKPRPRDESLPDLEINVPISVKDFSIKIQEKPSVILKELMKMGVLANINQFLDEDIVLRLTKKFGFNFVDVKTQEEQLLETHKNEEEKEEMLQVRAPVITFMGHVDHGKTSLLDSIRKSKIADSEHGGITQHMGAYSVKVPKGRITVLDTPGHEAFTAMRSRGAHITDLVVLVVAADEGVMPQTEEAIDHARAANAPIVVALNKIDKKNADIDRVKKQLAEHDLAPEDWDGKTVVVGVSATTGEGIDKLLELILLESEMLELRANAQKRAAGIVVEAHRSKGRGVVSSLIVQSGTLKENDFIVAGPFYGKIKAMFDDHQHAIKEAGPSMPVEILGLPDVPEAGETFYIVEDEKQAKEIAFRRQEQRRNKKLMASQKITLEDLYAQIQEGSTKEVNVILKADVQGSLEALKDSLEKIPSDKVRLKFIHSGVGDVNTSDVLLAVASKAIVIAFHVAISPEAKNELEKEPVDVRQYRIIYDAVNDIRNALEGLLEAKMKKKFLSRIEVREVFKLSKHGIVAGCYVLKGKVHRKVHVDVVREEDVVFSGTMSSLKRFKDDVREVNEGMECGVTIEGFDGYEKGDIIEAYELESIAQKL